VLLNVTGSVVLNLGTNVMKLAHNIRQHRDEQLKESNASQDNEKVRSPRPKVWYFGIIFFIVGSLVTFSSFGFAPQSLLAALGSVQFVSNVIFGSVILKEKVTRRIILGTTLILSGNVIVVIFSPRKEQRFTVQDLLSFYDMDYQIFLVCELVLMIALQSVYNVYDAREKAILEQEAAPVEKASGSQNGHPSEVQGQGEGSLGSMGGSSSRRLSGSLSPLPGAHLFMPISYALISAMVGTQSALQSKCLSELLNLTVSGNNQFDHYFFYIILVFWIITAVFWLYRMNRALALFNGLFIIPVLQVFWVFFAIIGGGIYFEEFQTISVAYLMGFICGVLVVFAGVFMLGPGAKVKDKKDMISSGGGDRGSGLGVKPPTALAELSQLTSRQPTLARGWSESVVDQKERTSASAGNRAHRVRAVSEEDLRPDLVAARWEMRQNRFISLGLSLPEMTDDEDIIHLVDQMELGLDSISPMEILQQFQFTSSSMDFVRQDARARNFRVDREDLNGEEKTASRAQQDQGESFMLETATKSGTLNIV